MEEDSTACLQIGREIFALFWAQDSKPWSPLKMGIPDSNLEMLKVRWGGVGGAKWSMIKVDKKKLIFKVIKVGRCK